MAARETPRIALVISTRDRVDYLEPTLRAVTNITSSHPWELILVDNGSTDGTYERLRQLRENAPDGLRIKILYEPLPGLARARNRGARATSAGLIAFTDDDCYPAPDLLDQIVAQFDSTHLAYLGGRVLLYDPRDLPVTIQERRSPLDIGARQYIQPGIIHGANLAVDARIFSEVGGFDERLGVGTFFASAEDSELLARLSWSGYAGRYHPGPVVHHHHRRRTSAELERLLHGYDKGRGAYMAIFIAQKASRPTYVKRWLLSLRDLAPRRLFRELHGAYHYLRRHGLSTAT